MDRKVMGKLGIKAVKWGRLGLRYLIWLTLRICCSAVLLLKRPKVNVIHSKNGIKCTEVLLSADGKGKGSEGVCLFWPAESGFSGRENLVDVTTFPRQIFHGGEFRIGIVCRRKGSSLSTACLLWEYLAVKMAGADVVYGFIEEADNEEHRVFLHSIRKAAFVGFDCIVGIAEGVKAEQGCRNFAFHPVRIFSAFCGPIAVVHRYVRVKDGWMLQQEGYLETTSPKTGNNIDLGGLRCWNDIITIGDILAVLQRKLPPRLEYLYDFSVSFLCARVAEAAPGSLFFFRQPAEKEREASARHFFQRRLPIKAWLKGCTFILSYCGLPAFIPHLRAEDTAEAHVEVMSWYRDKLSVCVIAVTGSTGKTSVKEMICRVLEQKFSVQKSERNANVQVKIGANLQRIEGDTDYFIQEIGGGSPGGASRHSRMVKPDMAVITNIGTAHIGNFGSREELFKNKMGLLDGMGKGGLLFVNGDDPLLRRARFPLPTVSFGIENRQVDYFGDNIRYEEGKTTFDILFAGKRVHAEIRMPGKHNVLNGLCSFAIGSRLGVPQDRILCGLLQCRTSGSRQNLLSIGGYRVLADCYNASLESVGTALSTLSETERADGKKIAVIGQLTGLGEMKGEVNRRLAELLSHCDADRIAYYGEFDPHICSLENVYFVDRKRDLERWVSRQAEPGDLILFKGSSKLDLDEAIDRLFGTNLSDQRHIDESQWEMWEAGKTAYRIFSSYATAAEYTGCEERVRLKRRIFGRPVTKIADRCFFCCRRLKRINLGGRAAHIGAESFAGCRSLEAVSGTESLKYIGEGAFKDCRRLSSFSFDRGLLRIGKSAFEDCAGLEKIVLPESLNLVERRAFAGCTRLRTVVVNSETVRIEREAFAGCSRLETVYLNREGSLVDAEAFRDCGAVRFEDKTEEQR